MTRGNRELIAKLRRAHKMSSSAPKICNTLYGDAADALESALWVIETARAAVEREMRHDYLVHSQAYRVLTEPVSGPQRKVGE